VSSYKNYITTTTLLLSLLGCVNSANIETKNDIKAIAKSFIIPKSKYFNYEDQYIIHALEYENQGMFNTSRQLYFKLFENTNKYEYLERFLNLSFALKDYSSVKKYASLYMLENIKEEEQILKLYTFSLLNLKEKEETIKYAKILVSKFKDDTNYSFLASIYFDLKEYEKAEIQFKKAYEIDKSVNILQTITNIQFFYTNKKEESKNTIKTYIQENAYPFSLSLQLLSFYEKDNQKQKIMPLLEKMYYRYKKDDNEIALLETQNLIIRYLINEDKKKAILFLEKNKIENEILISLYKNTNELQKAYLLLDKLYKESNNVEFLAQQAMVEFELAENKKIVLISVVSKFDKALETITNPIYENYLAYILIDYDLDIKKGLVLVKKALLEEPDNLAYLDTLAWGQYKNNDCENAHKNMKKVIDNVKFDDDEIKLHWEKIKECIK